MATQTNFTAEEWTLLRTAPAFVAGGMSASDPSGIFSSIKESAAGAVGMIEAYKVGQHLGLFAALMADRSRPTLPDRKAILGEGSRDQQLANLKAAVLAQARQAASVVVSKATAEEATAYQQMLVTVAEKAAHASKEGGFLGFGGTPVSTKEQAFLEELRSVLGLP